MLSQGKVQVATVNGQQVLIKPVGNNQWHIVAHFKTQPDGTLQIVPTNQVNESQATTTAAAATVTATAPVTQIVQTPPKQTMMTQQKIVLQTSRTSSPQISQPQPQPVLSPSIEQSLLQGQPPGTIIKCVTAEVTKNQNGPCIKLTGLQGSDFTEQQLNLVHQQVKQQLVKKGMYKFHDSVLADNREFSSKIHNDSRNVEKSILLWSNLQYVSHSLPLKLKKTAIRQSVQQKYFWPFNQHKHNHHLWPK